MSVQLVWFGNDLFVDGHLPLVRAAESGVVVCLHVDTAPAQRLLAAALDRQLRELGGELVRLDSPVECALDSIHRVHRIAALWSHEVTDARGGTVAVWCQLHGVPWKRFPLPVTATPGRPRAIQSPSRPAGVTAATDEPLRDGRHGTRLPAGGSVW